MKISPMAVGGAPAHAGVTEGHSAGADRIARATAIAAGQTPPAVPTEETVESLPPNLKKIIMHTQRTTNRQEALPAQSEEAIEPQSDILATTEQAPAAVEATQPLSPQFAALAKEKRALQAMKREIDAQKAALESKPAPNGQFYTKEQLQANALSVLREAGVTYDQLTEQLLAQDSGNPGLHEIRAEIKALKDGIEKAQVERDQANERQVLTQIRYDVDALIAEGDEFEAVRTAGYAPKVVELIHKVFQKEGKILDTAEAARLVENELIEEAMQWSGLKKVRSRLAPAQAPQQQPPAAKPSAPNTKIMRTLTNRDGASAISLSRRERAIAAAEGRLKT